MHSIVPVVCFWSPTRDDSPNGHRSMQILLEKAAAIEAILWSNGVTAADIMPPLKRGTYTPDDELDFEIFAQPSTLLLDEEGALIDDAIERITGLFGTLCPPLMDREGHISRHRLRLLHQSKPHA